MNAVKVEPLNVTGEERAILTELLESAHARLSVEIRHTHHRAFREHLSERMELLEKLLERCSFSGVTL